MKKITILDVYKKMELMSKLLNEIRPQHWYNPAEFIKQWDDAIPIWKFNNIYFKTVSKLQKALSYKYTTDSGVSCPSIETLRRITQNPDRISELFALGIQPEYIKKHKINSYYICTNGEFLHLNLTPYSRSYSDSYCRITDKETGQRETRNRAASVYNYFIDSHETSVYFIDGDYSNCRIDNLELRESH